jgi:hypothetical protein
MLCFACGSSLVCVCVFCVGVPPPATCGFCVCFQRHVSPSSPACLPAAWTCVTQVGVTQIILAISYRPDVMMEFLREIESLVGGSPFHA